MKTIQLTEREVCLLLALLELHAETYDFESAVARYGFRSAVLETADRYDIIEKLEDN